ncbi:MAG: polymer-forming cytoskeletal protein [candidate division WOR-3 bacterium]|nr:polymer-forming cytoskeletal protein [candidate division WOR-3 bacterium]
MFKKEETKQPEKLVTILGEDTNVKGDITVNGSARIDSQIEGKVNVSDMLIVGPRAFIKGDVNCKNAVIAGRIEGNVSAQMSIELQSGAYILGDISCASLVINKNCFFEGRCRMINTKGG